MPVIGWMNVVLAFVTLIPPNEYFAAWMTVWAFSTALVRPFSAGYERNAGGSWNGRATGRAPWRCWHAVKDIVGVAPLFNALQPLDSLSGNGWKDTAVCMGGGVRAALVRRRPPPPLPGPRRGGKGQD